MMMMMMGHHSLLHRSVSPHSQRQGRGVSDFRGAQFRQQPDQLDWDDGIIDPTVGGLAHHSR